jgi:hypothetical protein
LTLFYQVGVSPTNVLAFLPETLSTEIPDGPPFPVHPRQFPYEYENCISTFTSDIRDRLADAIDRFTRDPSVTCIVLMWLNNDNFQPLADLDDITSNDLANYCRRAGKPVLVVLDFAESTAFAQNTIAMLHDSPSETCIDAGFWTSSGLFPASLRPNKPLTLYDKLFAQQNHSMFCRVLLRQLAYKLERHDVTTLVELAERMNDPRRRKYGFHATFQATNPEMEDIAVRSFFPWAPLDPDAKSLVNPDDYLTEVIPHEEIDDVFDRVVGYWRKLKSRVPGACDMLVDMELLLPFSITVERTERLSPNYARHVPIYFLCEILAHELIFLHGDCHRKREQDDEWRKRVVAFIEERNGKLFPGQWKEVGRIYNLSSPLSIDTVMELIEGARIDLAARLGIPLPSYEW